MINLMVGNHEAIDEAIETLQKYGLVLKMVEGQQDYLSCKVKGSTDKKRAWSGQPHLIISQEKNLVNELQRFEHIKH